MNRFLILLTFLILSKPSQAQELVDMEFLNSYSAFEISITLAFIAPEYIGSFPISYNVDIYKVRYTSFDLNGEIDTLSGLLCSPESEDLRHPVLVYCHGTVADRNDVPSRLSDEHILGVLYGAMGYQTILPDYLGLGDSEGIHPYVHADSEASASYDMLRAIKENEATTGALTNDQVFITGYSQGGHAGMALHRLMETNTAVPYEVTAASHLSGPYSISEAMVDFTMGEEPYLFVAYLASVVISYDAAYGNILDGRGLSSFFLPEYASVMDRFVNEEIDLFDLNNELSGLLQEKHGAIIPRNMLRDSVLNVILNEPNSTIFQALQDNDVYDWSPQVPTRMYYCGADEQVTPRNAEIAIETMTNNGAFDVEGANLDETADHGGCVIPAMTATAIFFNTFLDIVSNYEDLSDSDELKIYPNPIQNQLIIEDGHNSNGSLQIFDVLGKRVYEAHYQSGNTILLSDWSPGNYFMVWQTERKTFTRKILKL